MVVKRKDNKGWKATMGIVWLVPLRRMVRVLVLAKETRIWA